MAAIRVFMLSEDEMSYYGTCLYGSNTFEIEEGLTVLIGRNGSGKTTLMRILGEKLGKAGIKRYDLNVEDGSERIRYRMAMRSRLDREDVQGLIDTSFASEGEKLDSSFLYMVRDLGTFIFQECAEEDECWVFLDSLDSGLSVDKIREYKDFIARTMLVEKPKDDLRIFVVVAANSYAFAEGSDCIDVTDGSHVRFGSYGEYVDRIFETRKRKDAR